jgi:hypothetical protein
VAENEKVESGPNYADGLSPLRLAAGLETRKGSAVLILRLCFCFFSART